MAPLKEAILGYLLQWVSTLATPRTLEPRGVHLESGAGRKEKFQHISIQRKYGQNMNPEVTRRALLQGVRWHRH